MRLGTLSSIVILLTPLALARPWVPGDECPTEINTIVGNDPCREGWDQSDCTEEPQLRTMVAVHAALSNCPNITVLDLVVRSEGCSGYPDRWDFPFHPSGRDSYPTLKTLRLKGYNFERGGWPREVWGFPKWRRAFPENDLPEPWDRIVQWMVNIRGWVTGGHWITWMQWFASGHVQRQKDNLDLWFDAMDWSEIEELKIEPVTEQVLKKMPGKLPALKKLETMDTSFIKSLENNTLTHFTWVGNSEPGDLSVILDRQGMSLQHLEFRCEEFTCELFIPNSDIGILPNMTRNLTHLTVNVPRNGTWPLESLQTIASLPHLRSADLYMNIQSPCVLQREGRTKQLWQDEMRKGSCEGEDQFQRPFVDRQGAEELFDYMRKQKQGAELTNVTLWIGDWSERWSGPLYFPPWVENRKSKVSCSVENNVEDEGWCVVETGERYWTRKYAYDYEYRYHEENEEIILF